MSTPRVVLDCRWLGLGGAGRVTELLLKELGAGHRDIRWILWGRSLLIRELTGRADTTVEAVHGPAALWGQRSVLSVPRGDVNVYMHQIRPLRWGRSVTVIYDTIPLHFGSRAARLQKWAFLRAVAAASTRVLTVSPSSAQQIQRDLGVVPDKIRVVTLAVDEARATRIHVARSAQHGDPLILYVGRYAEHKNLQALARAFQRTSLARNGGQLQFVGGSEREAKGLRRWLDAQGISSTAVGSYCTEEELDRLLVRAQALVMPSLEEGYGLPAFEAAAAGVPVAASRTGAMTELPPEVAVLFDARSESQMTQAIDLASAWPRVGPRFFPASTLASTLLQVVREIL